MAEGTTMSSEIKPGDLVVMFMRDDEAVGHLWAACTAYSNRYDDEGEHSSAEDCEVINEA